MFNPAGVLFRCFLIDASSDKLLREKSVTLIYFLSNLMAYGGQMEESIFIHS